MYRIFVQNFFEFNIVCSDYKFKCKLICWVLEYTVSYFMQVRTSTFYRPGKAPSP